jgi:hypothetical protein
MKIASQKRWKLMNINFFTATNTGVSGEKGTGFLGGLNGNLATVFWLRCQTEHEKL